MKLFELYAGLGLDTSDFAKGIQDSDRKSTSFISGLGEKFATAAKTLGKSMAVVAGAGLAGFTAMTKQAFDLFGPLEQNMGGVVAVFGEHAEEIQKHAANAAQNMGASMSDYLATINQMGSLAQGSGFSAAEAAEMTAAAMQRAADVASIMGLSSERAMESITGMFKGNYTMMDNLGVAINDAALAEYALSKGIKKTTQEMTAQEKTSLAYSLFMEKTAKYAGNYRKENETLSGSMEVLKAAWQNFLVGTDGSAETLVESIENVAKASFDTLGEIVPKLWRNVVDAAKIAFPKIETTVKEVMETELPLYAKSGANHVIDGVNRIFGTNIPHIGEISFPTWAEIKSAVSNWWNGSENMYERIKSLLSWTFGAFSGLGSEEISTSVSSWWENVGQPAAASVMQWTFGELVAPAWQDLVESVTTWWNTTIKPGVEDITEWIATPTLPSAESVIESVRTWWKSFVSVLESITKWNASVNIHQTYTPEELESAAAGWEIDTTAGATTPVRRQHAYGLPYVPFDDYTANLHRGEMVLTRRQAEEYRTGSAGGTDTAAILAKLDSVVAAIAGMSVNMDGQRVGDVVTDRVSRNIANDARRAKRY